MFGLGFCGGMGVGCVCGVAQRGRAMVFLFSVSSRPGFGRVPHALQFRAPNCAGALRRAVA